MSTTPSTPETPTTVEPGQIWRDNDQRTKGSGEFVVLAVVDGSSGAYTGVFTTRLERAMQRAEQRARKDGREYAVIKRAGATYLTRVRADRLLNGANTQRGYTYLGMQR